MNHIIKIIQFYKNLKVKDVQTVTTLMDHTNKTYYNQYKKIAIEKLNFLIYNEIIENDKCDYCFENIYNNNLEYIPICLNNRHFYLKPVKTQIFDVHITINDLIHTRVQIDDKTFLIMDDFIKIFPSFMVVYSESEHNHFEAGLIDTPIIKQDANLYFEDIYLIDWYITTFLIKDNTIENIIAQYKMLKNKYKETSTILILFKRNNRLYLYVILKRKDFIISTYEAMGYFLLGTPHQSLNIELSNAINKLKNGRIF